MTNLAQKKPTDDPADPIVQQSLLMPLTITVLALVLSLAWMVFDEFYTKQPWRHIYQPRYLNVAHDYWTVKQSEAEDRARLGILLNRKLDLIDRKYAGSKAAVEKEAADVIATFREEKVENVEDYRDWERRLVEELRKIKPPAPNAVEDETAEDPAAIDAEIKEVDTEIIEFIAARYLKKDENTGSPAEKLARAMPRISTTERLALAVAGEPGKEGTYERETREFLTHVAPIKGIGYRIELRDQAYKDIDGLVTDDLGGRNQRARYLADLYLFDSGRDKSIIETTEFQKREERVLRRGPAQQRLREDINALNNERIYYNEPRVEQRKTVSRLTAELEAIKGRITGIASHQIDLMQRFVQNQGANNIVDRCESCHTGTDKPGMDQGELWRVSGVFVAADFLDKYENHNFFENLTPEELRRVRFELETDSANKSYPGFENDYAGFEPSDAALPTFRELIEKAGAFAGLKAEATDDDGLTEFERRYGKGKKLDARMKAGYGLMVLARLENFLHGNMGQLGQVPNDPTMLVNNAEFIKLVNQKQLRVLFRYASRTFRNYVRDHLLMFASHPDTHGLLNVHKPSDFGCTACHEGQGRHMVSPEMAHGNYKHSLWQLFKDGYYEAGCQMCHNKQIEMDGAPQLQAARDQFMRNGCWGCHKYEGFEPQADERMNVSKELGDLRTRESTIIATLEKAQRRLKELEALYAANTDDLRIEEEFRRIVPAQIQASSYELYEVQRQIAADRKRLAELETEAKHVGPNLSQLAAKVEDPSWIARWVRYPKGFRPSTKMPHFFYGPFSYEKDDDGNALLDKFGNHVLNEENVTALKLIVAYIWQASKWAKERGYGNVTTPGGRGGDGGPNTYEVKVGDSTAENLGKQLFETRGCMGCHTNKPDMATISVKEDGKDLKLPMPVGKYLRADGKPTMNLNEAARDKSGLPIKNEDAHSWAANLSRVGEKNHPDYLVEWILQPRKKDPHSVMPSIWSAAEDFDLTAANVRALKARIEAAFGKAGLANYQATDFYLRPETSFAPPGLNLSGPEIAALRKDLTVLKCIEEAKLVVAYLKSLKSPDKDALNAPQEEIFKRTNSADPYGFLEKDGEFTESIVRAIDILPHGQKDDPDQAKEAELKTRKLKGYAEFKRLMDEMDDAKNALRRAREDMAKTLQAGGDVSKFAEVVVQATQRIRDARDRIEGSDKYDGTFAGFGKKYVAYYGCASCHTIPGMEDEGKIGTELTYQGSKLIERLDFGHNEEHPQPEDPHSAHQSEFAPLMTRARNGSLGGHGFELPGLFRRDFIKGKKDYFSKLVWFTGKVYSPRQFDKGKRRSNWFERLRMPLFELDDEETRLIGMFIAGSREIKLPPEKFIYQLKGEAKVKADGWWIFRKYNCVGCHNIGRHEARIRRTERFAVGINAELNTPPMLHDAGLRLNPAWAVAWLQQPYMVRHMQVEADNTGLDLGLRMPNFGLTESEARTIVSFLAYYAKAPQTYSPPPNVALTQQEQDFARAVMASEDCKQCHEYREDVDGYQVPGPKAPNLVQPAQRIRYQWVHGWLLDPDLIQPGPKRMFRFFRPTPDGKSIFNDNPAQGGDPNFSKIIKLDLTDRWPREQWPDDPAAVLRDYVLFYYPKTRAGQQELQDLTNRVQDAKAKIK